MKIKTLAAASIALLTANFNSGAQNLKINDLEYFEETGVNVLVYSNKYDGMFCDEKTAGIELIMRGVRVSTGGGIRLMNTPEQWDIYPEIVSRTVDTKTGTISVVLNYPDYDFKTTVAVKADGKGYTMTASIDKPVPEFLKGKAGMNIEFFPATYFGKTYLIDGRAEIFPRHPSSVTTMHPTSEKITQFFGLSTFDDRGRNEFIVADPIAKGKKLVIAPEDKDLRVSIEGREGEINLFDGRNLSQNGTFVVRTIFPAGKTGTVAQWYIEPYSDPSWIRKPNIGFSQIGYVPGQKKVSVLELDRNDKVAATAKIIRIMEDGSEKVVLTPSVKEWGVFNNRYNYARTDFSEVKEPGLYCIEYKGERTNVFPIGKNVYDGKWTTTMDVWLPAQMDHMEVREGYRIWHGRSHMDDALQAPVGYQQMDGYSQPEETYTKYKSLEHIPNLAVGAWYDAGDFDIQAGTVVGLTQQFADMWEDLRVERDQTYIDQETQFAEMHRPDGLPDVIQQCEHGALNICAQVENIGFVAQGIVQGHMHQYPHIGDGVTITDNFVYDPSLKPYEQKGLRTGTLDDRLAFTGNFSAAGTMSSVAALAAAARVLKPYKPETSERCLRNALMLWEKYFEDADPSKAPANGRRGWGFGFGGGDSRTSAAIELWKTTGEKKYKDFFEPKVKALLEPQQTIRTDNRPGRAGSDMNEFASMMRFSGLSTALGLYPVLDKDTQDKVKSLIPEYVKSLEVYESQNPYGVPVTGRSWGGNEQVLRWAQNIYTIWKLFPEMVDPNLVLRGLEFLYGNHPYSNVSFINAIGVNTKKVAYGTNRADYTVIPGGIVPGLLMLSPDFFEHKDDYPFLWGENECCTRNVPSFVTLSIAAEQIAEVLDRQ